MIIDEILSFEFVFGMRQYYDPKVKVGDSSMHILVPLAFEFHNGPCFIACLDMDQLILIDDAGCSSILIQHLPLNLLTFRW